MKHIMHILFFIACIVFLLWIGGYTPSSFSREIEMKGVEVFDPLTKSFDNVKKIDLPGLPTYSSQTDISLFPDNSDPDSSNSTNQTGTNETTLVTNVIKIDHSTNLKITIGDKTVEFNSTTSATFIKWLVNNYTSSKPVQIDIVDPTEPSEGPSNSTEPSETTKKPVTSKDDLPYNDVLTDLAELEDLVDSIKVVDELEDITGYNRKEYEKPVKSYIYEGTRYNRNDYSWITSRYLVSADPFKYTCPYTGQVILDDSKLDYDHIVPLGSTYKRGAAEWSDEEKNAYAYDQWVGVDVLYSANRSKSDKGPCEYLPDENVEDYCYSWLLICSYYDLTMTDEEIEICVDTIKDAFQDGETVEHLGGHYVAP